MRDLWTSIQESQVFFQEALPSEVFTLPASVSVLLLVQCGSILARVGSRRKIQVESEVLLFAASADADCDLTLRLLVLHLRLEELVVVLKLIQNVSVDCVGH